jgi:hypothetical protein
LRYAPSSAELVIIGMEPAAMASNALGAGSEPPPCAQAVKEVPDRNVRNFSKSVSSFGAIANELHAPF